MATLGDLERNVMDLLWDSGDALSAYDLLDRLPSAPGARPLAPTTVLTVLSRLEKKGFVERERSSRPHRYSARSGRDAHVAELMHEVLGGAADRVAVLERFVGQVSPDEAATLRRLLDGADGR
ncbi:MAG: BlaI/MecI/CopY family transcriptional regulator [Microbacteriaceae bacterium]